MGEENKTRPQLTSVTLPIQRLWDNSELELGDETILTTSFRVDSRGM